LSSGFWWWIVALLKNWVEEIIKINKYHLIKINYDTHKILGKKSGNMNFIQEFCFQGTSQGSGDSWLLPKSRAANAGEKQTRGIRNGVEL
jgi:hypothetical protein